MKIISWNINGYRAVTGQNPKRKFDQIIKDDNRLFPFIEKYDPDVICLQETKSHPEQIREDLIAPPGFENYLYSSCHIKKGYSGVVIFSKIKPKSSSTGFGIKKFDQEGRFVQMDFGNFVLMNIYFPNGQKGQERIDYKLDFYEALFSYAGKMKKEGKKILICGDYNTAHKEIDLARPKANVKTSGFLPEERVVLDKLFENDWVDTFRMFNDEGDNYTWWSNRGSARENNVGWRIDYHVVSDNLAADVKNSYHLPHEFGSDHCPIVVELF